MGLPNPNGLNTGTLYERLNVPCKEIRSPLVSNGALVNQEVLIELLLAEESAGCEFSHHSSVVSVVRGEPELVERAAVAQADTIILELNAVDSLKHRVHPLKAHLQGFEISPLKAAIDTCDSPIGAYCSPTSNSVLEPVHPAQLLLN